jgi:hypothetical protein
VRGILVQHEREIPARFVVPDILATEFPFLVFAIVETGVSVPIKLLEPILCADMVAYQVLLATIQEDLYLLDELRDQLRTGSRTTGPKCARYRSVALGPAFLQTLSVNGTDNITSL